MLQLRWGCFFVVFSLPFSSWAPSQTRDRALPWSLRGHREWRAKARAGPAAFDPPDHFGDEMLLRFEQREPVFGLDEKQRRDVLATDLLDLQRERRRIFLDRQKPLPKKRERFIGRQHRQQAKRGLELRISLTGSAISSAIQVRNSSRPAGVISYTVRSGRRPSRPVSRAAMKARRSKSSITV